jgi:hypothetical protein
VSYQRRAFQIAAVSPLRQAPTPMHHDVERQLKASRKLSFGVPTVDQPAATAIGAAAANPITAASTTSAAGDLDRWQTIMTTRTQSAC